MQLVKEAISAGNFISAIHHIKNQVRYHLGVDNEGSSNSDTNPNEKNNQTHGHSEASEDMEGCLSRSSIANSEYENVKG